MPHSSERDQEDLAHTCWTFPELIASNPARSLATPDLAMDFFAQSPFWDSRSNNSVLRTQRSVDHPGYGHAQEKIELNAFKAGFEYVIAHSQSPRLFIIHLREVESTGKRDRVTGIWMILDNVIYQSPTLFDIMAARLKNATALISKSLSALSENRPLANPRTTPVWRCLPPQKPAKPLEDDVQRQTDEKKEDVDMSSPDGQGTSENSTLESAPDWRLFHALQSTSSSLEYLDSLAHTSIPHEDPNEELKSIEMMMSGQRTSQPKMNQDQQTSLQAASIRSGSVQPGLKFGVVNAGRPDLAPSNTSLRNLSHNTTDLGGASPARWLTSADKAGFMEGSNIGTIHSPLTGSWVAGQ
ncbi:uncharacterized protein L203_103606 [Cryptococcus depauperatus CBS 7841]|uniref:Mediator of RNA polymerase II transcription subunit 6 n=1 Tax=Cryptococcus depauperatus CBS 7841 TaxID=1295531 RepID=A0AAJ8M281_9TREE